MASTGVYLSGLKNICRIACEKLFSSRLETDRGSSVANLDAEKGETRLLAGSVSGLRPRSSPPASSARARPVNTQNAVSIQMTMIS